MDALRAADRVKLALGELAETSEIGNGRPRLGCARRWQGWAAKSKV
jgi:hypothetical protein